MIVRTSVSFDIYLDDDKPQLNIWGAGHNFPALTWWYLWGTGLSEIIYITTYKGKEWTLLYNTNFWKLKVYYKLNSLNGIGI